MSPLQTNGVHVLSLPLLERQVSLQRRSEGDTPNPSNRAKPMGEGKPILDDDDEDGSAVVKILQETNKLLEKKRRRAQARKLRKLMKDYNSDVQRLAMAGQELLPETQVELDLDESESEKLRKLQEMEEEIAAGLLLTHAPCGNSKYEAPAITQLRAVETVEEMYHLADQIIRLPTMDNP